MIRYRPAAQGDAAYIAAHLRGPDRRELLASGRPSATCLSLGVSLGESWVWEFAGEPIVLFGVTPVSRSVGAAWLVGTPGMERHQRQLLRAARPWVERLNRRWPLLCNAADARNALHLRFIRWLGFTFFAERRLGGLRFLDFAKVRSTSDL